MAAPVFEVSYCSVRPANGGECKAGSLICANASFFLGKGCFLFLHWTADMEATAIYYTPVASCLSTHDKEHEQETSFMRKAKQAWFRAHTPQPHCGFPSLSHLKGNDQKSGSMRALRSVPLRKRKAQKS
jgi:hypothetical protein